MSDKFQKRDLIGVASGFGQMLSNIPGDSSESESKPGPVQTTSTNGSTLWDWANWNIGEKIIVVCACVAVVSMLMKWVDVGFASANGFSQGTFLLLGVYVYPLLKIHKKAPIEMKWGYACGGVGIVLTLLYISSRSASFFGREVNLAGTGAYIFLLSCIGLCVGVFQYLKSVDDKSDLSIED